MINAHTAHSHALSLMNLIAVTGGRAEGFEPHHDRFDRIVTDSRHVGRGDVFCALRGPNHDGHTFATAAQTKGAAACIVERAWGEKLIGPRLIVDDTRTALGDIARDHRERHDALVVAVTGSVGKTTTRELLHTVLGTRFHGCRSPRNFNNDVGLPLSLLQIEPDHEYAIVEVGASAPGEIVTLAGIARPDVTVVTRVAPAHLEGFGSVEAIADEKAALVTATSPTGFVVLNGDDPLVRDMARRTDATVFLVGESDHNDLRGTIVSSELGGLRVQVDGTTYEIPVTGRHHLVPVLAAIAVAREIGIPPLAIDEGLRRFEPPNGRCRVETIGPWTVVNDAYNASPSAMAAACRLLAECSGDRPRILVAGDMLELGPHADRLHAEIGRLIAEAGIDHLLFHGTRAERVAHEARLAGMDAHRLAVCPDFDALLAVLDCTLEPGAVVLVKGSRSMRMERAIGWLRCRAEELALEDAPSPPTRAVA